MFAYAEAVFDFMPASFTIKNTTPATTATNRITPTTITTITHQGNGRPPFLPFLELLAVVLGTGCPDGAALVVEPVVATRESSN